MLGLLWNFTYTTISHPSTYPPSYPWHQGKEHGLMLWGFSVQLCILGTKQSWPCSLTEKGWDDQPLTALGLLIPLRNEGSLSYVIWDNTLAVSWCHMCVLGEGGNFTDRHPDHFSRMRNDLGKKVGLAFSPHSIIFFVLWIFWTLVSSSAKWQLLERVAMTSRTWH